MPGDLNSGSSIMTGAVRTTHSVTTTPVDPIAEINESTPLSEQVQDAYVERQERIRVREWRVDKTRAETQRLLPEPRVPVW